MSAGQAAPPTPVRTGTVLRALFAAGLVAYLLWLSDPRAVGRAMADASWPPLLLVVILVLADRALMAQRWFALLQPLGADAIASRAAILKVFFVSTFVGSFLPASIGGDAARSYSLARLGVPLSDAVASVFVDRMLGVLSLLMMACAGLVLASDLAGVQAVTIGLAAAGSACAAAAALVFSPAADRFAASVLPLVPAVRMRAAINQILSSLRRYAEHHAVLGRVLALSCGVQVLRIVQAALLGVALGIDAGLQAYFAFVPLIMLVMLLPVTVNGLGTSQAAFVWFFARTATPAHEAFALSILFVGLQIVGNVPGAVFFMRGDVSEQAGRPNQISS